MPTATTVTSNAACFGPVTSKAARSGPVTSNTARFGPVASTAGATVTLVRRATFADADALHRFYESLDPESRYRRFLQPLPRLPSALAARVIESSDVVLVAEDLNGALVAEGVLAGLGREAEVAYAVAAPFRRAGLASRLVRELASIAHRAGASTLRATIGGDNHPSIALMRSLGATVRFDDGELVASLDLGTSAR